MGIQLLELLYFAISSPTEIAVAGFPQIGIRDLVEPSCRVETRRELVGHCLIVDKGIGVRGADGLFVKTHGIQLAAFYSGYLRPDQCRPIFKILRAVLGPYFEMLLVSYQSFGMKLSLFGRCEIPGSRVRKRAIETKLCCFKL